MKKFLLMMVAAVFAVNASAQQNSVVFNNQVKGNVFSVKQASAAVEVAPGVKKGPKKNAANGVLYNRPEGTMYHAWSKEGSGYGPTFLFVPPFTDIVFKNVSTAEGDAVWTLNEKEYAAEEDGTFNFGSLSIQDPYDAPGGVSYYPMPTLTIGEASFTLGTEGKYSSYPTTSGIVVDTLNTLSFTDQHVSGYGFGSLGTHYLYGTGTLSNGRTCFAVEQDFEKPAAPLYIQDAYLPYYSTQELPIPEGKEVTLSFVALDEEGNLGEVLGQMKATHESFSDVEDVTSSIASSFPTWESSNWYSGTVTFSNKTTDIFGNVVEEPIIINEAFAILIEGFDQEGVSIGFTSTSLTDGTNVPVCYFVCEDPSTGSVYNHYYSDESLHISFTAMYDVAVLQDSDTGEYTAPAEGGTVTRAEDADYDVAYVYTAYPWYDNLGNENYFVYVEYPEGDPEWITTTIDDSYYNQTDSNDNYYGVTMIGMEAEALPESVEGRYATVYVYGPAAEVSFVVKQGEVTAIKGVTVKEDSKFAGATYNLAGQKVGADYKGIVIENGKKVVKK